MIDTIIEMSNGTSTETITDTNIHAIIEIIVDTIIATGVHATLDYWCHY